MLFAMARHSLRTLLLVATVLLGTLVCRPAHAQITTGTIFGSGYGLSPGDRDSLWKIVATPSSFTPPGGQTMPYDSYVTYSIPSSLFIGNGTPQVGVTGTVGGVPVTNYWITPTPTTGQIAAPRYRWIAQQTFTVPQTGFYRFDFPAAGDNLLEFFIDGSINYVNPNAPTISGGQQIGGMAGSFSSMTTFTGGAELTAGTHTASMVLTDDGFETAAIIGSSTFAPTVAYWAPSSGAGGNGTWNNSNSFWSPSSNGSGTKLPWTSGVGVAYFGGTPGTVSVSENVNVNQIYFTTGGYNIQGGGGDIVWGPGATVTARSGESTISARQATTTGQTLKVGGGAGTVVFQGTTHLEWTSQLLVDGGKLLMNGNMTGPGNGVVYLAGGSIGGTGSMNVALAGSGLVAPGPSGTNSGILTAPVLAPADGLDFQFVFSGTVPNYFNTANSTNDVLRLTSGSPFASGLTSANTKTLFLNFTKEQLTLGTTLEGGFFTDADFDFTSFLNNQTWNNAGFQIYVLGDGQGTDNRLNGQGYYNWRNPAMFGWDQSVFMSTVPRTANFGGAGNVTGQVMLLTVAVPEPSTYAMALAGLACGGFGMWRRRKRLSLNQPTGAVTSGSADESKGDSKNPLVSTCWMLLAFLLCVGSRKAVGSELYLTSYFNGTVGKFAADGTPINTSLITGLSNPSGIKLGPDGFLYVANRGSGNVGRYSTTGSGNATFLTGLSAPFGIAFDGNGDMYVASYQSSNSVRKYSANGTPLNMTYITGLPKAEGLAFDPAGNLYVSDFQLGTV